MTSNRLTDTSVSGHECMHKLADNCSSRQLNRQTDRHTDRESYVLRGRHTIHSLESNASTVLTGRDTDAQTRKGKQMFTERWMPIYLH